MSSNTIEIVHGAKAAASLQMQRDIDLLDGLERQSVPFVRFYDWASPTITYGHFIDPTQYLKPHVDFDLAKRPTGGGLLFHVHDFPFSVAIPAHHPKYSGNTLDSYHMINEVVLGAVLEVCGGSISLDVQGKESSYSEFCMASATKYDLLLNGIKIGGAAQRRTKHGFLHQGTIFLTLPPWDKLEEALIDGKEVVKVMKSTSCGLCREEEVEEVRGKLKNAMEKAFTTFFNYCF